MSLPVVSRGQLKPVSWVGSLVKNRCLRYCNRNCGPTSGRTHRLPGSFYARRPPYFLSESPRCCPLIDFVSFVSEARRRNANDLLVTEVQKPTAPRARDSRSASISTPQSW